MAVITTVLVVLVITVVVELMSISKQVGLIVRSFVIKEADKLELFHTWCMI